MKVHYTVKGRQQDSDVVMERLDADMIRLVSGDEAIELKVAEVGPGEYLLLDGDRVHDLLVVGRPPGIEVLGRSKELPVTLLDEHQVAMAERAGYGTQRADGVVAVRAPMPGKVVKSLVEEGEVVRAGQGVIVVEAMKMENELKCPVDGTVKRMLVAQGQSVEANQELVIIE